LSCWWALTDGRADSWGVGSISILAAVSLSLRLLPPVPTYVTQRRRAAVLVIARVG
jgi:hypothetical protein